MELGRDVFVCTKGKQIPHDAGVPILTWLQQNEALGPPTDGHDTSEEFIPDKHGFNGSVKTSLPSVPLLFDDLVLATLDEFPDEFPFNQDMVGVDVDGFGRIFPLLFSHLHSV